jgi:alkane 1-monooxygenase
MKLSKRLAFLVFLFPVAAPILAVFGALRFGHPLAFAAITPIVMFVAIPILDVILGRDAENPTEDEARSLAKKPYFSALLLLCLPIQFGLVGLGIWFAKTGELNALELLAYSITFGMVGGITAINVGHELIHRKSPWLSSAGGVLLSTVGYASFKVEHVIGHHVHVATPEDGSSAARGESVYGFVARAFVRNIPKAFELEKKMLERKGKNLFRHGELVRYYAFTSAMACGALAWGGLRGVVLFVGQGVVAIALLEVVNYVEHYGLTRNRIGTKGAYETTTIHHSWNSNYALTNLLLFQLQRHSDHHANAARPYQSLRHMPESPQLPFGYATMVALALCPPVFKLLMDRALRQHAEARGARSDASEPRLSMSHTSRLV